MDRLPKDKEDESTEQVKELVDNFLKEYG